MKFKPAYLIIPYLTIENENLQPLDRILYGVIYYFEKMRDGKCVASNKTLAEYCHTKNSLSIANSLNRLEEEKFIVRIFKDKNKKVRKEIKGMIDFRVSSNDDTVSSNDDRRVSSFDEQISNSNINKSRSTIKQTAVCGNEINILIEKFKPINPSYEKLFKNKTQRTALEEMYKKYGFAKLGRMIDALPEIVKQKFAPTITTPCQLEDKLGSLLVFISRNKKTHCSVKERKA